MGEGSSQTDASKGRVTVFFPVFNEGASAGSLVARTDEACMSLGRPYRILVVDDGSTDDSRDQVRARSAGVPLVLLEHGRNRGLRAALATGLLWLSREVEEGEVCVTMDGDDTHDPAQIAAMLERIDEGADVVVASRFRRGAEVRGVPGHRRLFSAGANLWGTLFFRIPGIRDYACGFRAIRGKCVRELVASYGDRLFELEAYGFICSVELLVKLSDVAERFAEVPIRLRYDRKVNSSKMDAVRTTLGYVALLRARRRSRAARSDG